MLSVKANEPVRTICRVEREKTGAENVELLATTFLGQITNIQFQVFFGGSAFVRQKVCTVSLISWRLFFSR